MIKSKSLELTEIAGILIKTECLLQRNAGAYPPRWLKHAIASVGDAIDAIEEQLKEEEVSQ